MHADAQQKPAKYTDFDRGNYYYSLLKMDSAFLMYNRYINNADDTLNKGKAYSYMGDIQWSIGDLYGAQQSLTGAIKTLDPNNPKHREELGYAYNLLGNVSLDLKNFDEAIGFYNHAVPFFQGNDYLPEVMNGKATAYQKKRSYNEAIALYDSILAFKTDNQQRIARILDNRAKTRWLQNPSYPVLADFQQALNMRIAGKNTAGMNASYAHLADYYTKINTDSALWYAQKMRETAIGNQSPDDILEATDKLIRLSGTPETKERWYESYKILNDSLQLSRDTTRNRFALIRYDVQKSKADNLVLQQHISRQQLMMYGLAALAILIIILLYTWYNKRRKRIKREAESSIRESRLKTSQKVHDVVANGLYTIMNELEHRPDIEREPLMNKIEGLYEKSRNISYEDAPEEHTADYDSQVHGLLTSFANDQTKVFVIGNQPAFWDRISHTQKHEIQLILNELMVNMKKHSQASTVSVKFRQEGDRGFITYKDDGIGLPENMKYGNGLQNTVNRTKTLHGEIIFGKNEKAGVSIEISFPLEPRNS